MTSELTGKALHTYLLANLYMADRDEFGLICKELRRDFVKMSYGKFTKIIYKLCNKINTCPRIADIYLLGQIFNELFKSCYSCNSVFRKLTYMEQARFLYVGRRLAYRYPKMAYMKLNYNEFTLVKKNFRKLMKMRKYYKFWSKDWDSIYKEVASELKVNFDNKIKLIETRMDTLKTDIDELEIMQRQLSVKLDERMPNTLVNYTEMINEAILNIRNSAKPHIRKVKSLNNDALLGA